MIPIFISNSNINKWKKKTPIKLKWIEKQNWLHSEQNIWAYFDLNQEFEFFVENGKSYNKNNIWSTTNFSLWYRKIVDRGLLKASVLLNTKKFGCIHIQDGEQNSHWRENNSRYKSSIFNRKNHSNQNIRM